MATSPAALRSQVKRHFSGHVNTFKGSNMVSQNGDANESTSLLGGRGESQEEGDKSWKSWPKSFVSVTWETLKSNVYVNWLLVFVPLGIIAGALGWSPTAVFILNFLAIVPLASLLSFATEELSVKLGQTLGGLLNATFGNAVELIVSLMTVETLPQWLRYHRLVSLH